MTETTCPQQEIATQQVSQDPGRENPLEGSDPLPTDTLSHGLPL